MPVAELELTEWCNENAKIATPCSAKNLLVVRYEDAVRAGRIHHDIWELLQKSGIELNIDWVDLSRPSRKTNIAEMVSLRNGKMIMKYHDFFDQSEIDELRRIFQTAGIMRNERESVFGHEII